MDSAAIKSMIDDLYIYKVKCRTTHSLSIPTLDDDDKSRCYLRYVRGNHETTCLWYIELLLSNHSALERSVLS